MYIVAKLDDKNRDILFSKYALDNGINKAVVEKDFWVTLILDYLFHKSKYSDYFVFKGGTSLSKCFNLINRFSEDIDLILRWNKLTNEEPEKETKTSQQKYNKRINDLAAKFIKEDLKTDIESFFEAYILSEFSVQVDECDPQVLLFNYPRLYKTEEAGILKYVRLEIGPLAALSPTKQVSISPYISTMNLPIFEKMTTFIETVTPERTFWEKVLILHQEAHRPEDKKLPSRYSRHYYDVYKISLSKYKESAYDDLNLLDAVRNFKIRFYPSNWSNYESAIPNSIKLVPPNYRIDELKKDYEKMNEMFNEHNLISFENLLIEIKKIEDEINLLQK